MKTENLVTSIIANFLREQGAKGGKARAASLTPERRAEIARIAGSAPKKPRKPKDKRET